MTAETPSVHITAGERVRWLISILLVTAVHASLALFLLRNPTSAPVVPVQPVPAAAPIVMELAALPSSSQPAVVEQKAEEAEPEKTPPQPERVAPQAEVKEIPAAPVKIAVRDTPPPPKKVERPRQKPPERPVKKPRQKERTLVKQQAVQRQDNSSEQKSISNRAPRVGAASAAQQNARMNWESDLLARLQKAKRYPAYALRTKQEDQVLVRFTLDRDGNLLQSEVIRSQGYSALDNESLALIRRASPLPKPPAETLQGNRIEMVVPIEFFIHRGS